MSLWHHDREPTLYMANHPHAKHLARPLVDLNLKSRHLKVVCDAGIAPLARCLGVSTITVNTLGKSSSVGNVDAAKRMKLVQQFGKQLNLYERAYKGQQLIDKIVDDLREGWDIIIFPTGNSDPNAKWRSGIGAIATQVYTEPVIPAFVHIPETPLKPPRVVRFNNFRDILPDLPGQSINISRALQTRFNQSF